MADTVVNLMTVNYKDKLQSHGGMNRVEQGPSYVALCIFLRLQN